MQPSRTKRLATLLPTPIGFALGIMMGVGQDEAEINLCNWLRKLWPSLPDACLHGTPTWSLYLISIGLILIGPIWFFWPHIANIIATLEFTWPIRRKKASAWAIPAPIGAGTNQAGLYVSDIRFTFTDLEKERHSEISMRVFNGTGYIVEFSHVSGHVQFSAPNSIDPSRSGDLPTPSPRSDMVKIAAPFQEWLLILNQRIPSVEADKLLAMLEADIPIHFNLNSLVIEVCAQIDRHNVARLPILVGVSYSRGMGFGQIVSTSICITG